MSDLNYGITYNGLHSYRDFGLKVTDKEVGFPEKDKVVIQPPYKNNIIDLSALYGENIFKDRKFTITFLIIDRKTSDKQVLYQKWTDVVNWLMGTEGRSALIDDIMPDYYYMAEPQTAPSWKEFRAFGRFTVEFNCYPFRISIMPEGWDLWPFFRFSTDVMQESSYDIKGTKKFVLYNAGREISQPVITLNQLMTITANGHTEKYKVGTINPDTVAYPLVLKPGINEITVTGTGHIDFDWRKELI